MCYFFLPRSTSAYAISLRADRGDVGGPVAAEEVEDDEEGDGEVDAVAVAAGMTAEQLADQIGVDLSQINDFIGNNQKPSQEIALRICHGY